MKKLDIEIVEQGNSLDTINYFLPSSVNSLTDDEMMEIYGGTTSCNCKYHDCKHCLHIECLKICRTKLFGDNTEKAISDTSLTPTLIVK